MLFKSYQMLVKQYQQCLFKRMYTTSTPTKGNRCNHLFSQTTHCALCQVQKDGDCFSFMAAPRTYSIDLKELKRKFMKEQTKYHPDLFMHRPMNERQESEMISAQLNKAYRTLMDPVSRAKHLLKLAGYQVSENTKIADPNLLMHVMDIQERVVSADQLELDTLLKDNEKRFKATVGDLGRAFEAKDYEFALQLIVKLNYWTTIRKLIDDRLA